MHHAKNPATAVQNSQSLVLHLDYRMRRHENRTGHHRRKVSKETVGSRHFRPKSGASHTCFFCTRREKANTARETLSCTALLCLCCLDLADCNGKELHLTRARLGHQSFCLVRSVFLVVGYRATAGGQLNLGGAYISENSLSTSAFFASGAGFLLVVVQLATVPSILHVVRPAKTAHRAPPPSVSVNS